MTIISPIEQENISLIMTYAFIKHNPNFRCRPKNKKIALEKYRSELIERGIDMNKVDIQIFKEYLNGCSFCPYGPDGVGRYTTDLNLAGIS